VTARPRPSVPSERGEVLAGPHAVLEALRAGRRVLRRIWLARREQAGSIAGLLSLARERGVPVQVRPRGDLDRVVQGVPHQGVLAEVGPFPYEESEELVSRALRSSQAAFLIALDGIQDPQNLGAIIRTAEAAGAHGLILPRDRAAAVTPAAVRASAGAAEYLAVARVTNLAAFLEWVKAQGVWVAGADPAGGRLLYSVDLKGPVVLVIGGEGRGLRPLIRSRCDVKIRIPILGKVESLNASSAAAVCIFEVVRQRHGAKAG
jgi:23S rRNA (guanosine2251-2'-O)-methyltransferase